MTKTNYLPQIQHPKAQALLLFCLSLISLNTYALVENYIPVGSDYIFYTGLVAGILFAALIIIAYREFKWLSYAGFAALLALDLASMDGTLAYLLGNSDYVLWLVPFLIHACVTSYGYGLIASHLDTHHPLSRYRPVIISLAILSALFPITSFFWIERIPLPTLWLAVNSLFFVMILMQVLPPLTWKASTQFETTLTRYLAIIIVAVTLLLYSSYYLSNHTTASELINVNRIALLLFSLGSLSIVILRLFIHNQEKERAKQDALIAAKKQAETELTLLRLEHNYQDALSIASKHQSQLSSVSHDLKQPIAVLRMVLNQLRRSDQDNEAHRLSHAVNYMDDLIQQLLTKENNESEPDNHAEQRHNPSSTETISTALLAQTLEQMFQGDAKAKQQQFTIRYHQAELTVEPLMTMRLMNNLVANAIAHSKANRILVTFRWRQDHLLFQVFDNGCGIPPAQLPSLLESGQKSTQSSGQGLGLGIVRALCDQHGMTFTIKSKVNKGTQCNIRIPL